MKEMREKLIQTVRQHQDRELRQSLISQKLERARHYVEMTKRLERDPKVAH